LEKGVLRLSTGNLWEKLKQTSTRLLSLLVISSFVVEPFQPLLSF